MLLAEWAQVARDAGLTDEIEWERKPGTVLHIDSSGVFLRAEQGMVPYCRALPSGRSSNIAPRLLTDTWQYVLGNGPHGLAFRRQIENLAAETGSALLGAIVVFYGRARSSLPLPSDDESLYAFSVEGSFPHDEVAVRRAWTKCVDEHTGGPQAPCLVCGQMRPTMLLHESPRGLRSALLVSFNLPCVQLPGRSQGEHAPVCLSCGRLYVRGLSHLLSRPETCIWADDGALLCWNGRIQAIAISKKRAAIIGIEHCDAQPLLGLIRQMLPILRYSRKEKLGVRFLFDYATSLIRGKFPPLLGRRVSDSIVRIISNHTEKRSRCTAETIAMALKPHRELHEKLNLDQRPTYGAGRLLAVLTHFDIEIGKTVLPSNHFDQALRDPSRIVGFQTAIDNKIRRYGEKKRDPSILRLFQILIRGYRAECDIRLSGPDRLALQAGYLAELALLPRVRLSGYKFPKIGECQTPEEEVLCHELRRHGFDPMRNFPVRPEKGENAGGKRWRQIDLAFPDDMLGVELHGGGRDHSDDFAREVWLRSKGWEIMVVQNELTRCESDLTGVVEEIERRLKRLRALRAASGDISQRQGTALVP